jgi:hypothetical protein
MVGIGHRVVLLRLIWRSFEGSRDDRPISGYDTPPTSGYPYTTSLDATRFESPAAPISRLARAGEHCFGTPLEVAAAAARVAAYYERVIREYENARRIANAGGPLPPAGANMVGEVSDPDGNNCILVNTYRYEDRYWIK